MHIFTMFTIYLLNAILIISIITCFTFNFTFPVVSGPTPRPNMHLGWKTEPSSPVRTHQRQKTQRVSDPWHLIVIETSQMDSKQPTHRWKRRSKQRRIGGGLCMMEYKLHFCSFVLDSKGWAFMRSYIMSSFCKNRMNCLIFPWPELFIHWI